MLRSRRTPLLAQKPSTIRRTHSPLNTQSTLQCWHHKSTSNDIRGYIDLRPGGLSLARRPSCSHSFLALITPGDQVDTQPDAIPNASTQLPAVVGELTNSSTKVRTHRKFAQNQLRMIPGSNHWTIKLMAGLTTCRRQNQRSDVTVSDRCLRKARCHLLTTGSFR